MKATLKITSAYGFDHRWSLLVETKTKSKSFYLGQDVKFCSRILGMSARQVVEESGIHDLRSEENRETLARWIASRLGINGQNLHLHESWAFAAD